MNYTILTSILELLNSSFDNHNNVKFGENFAENLSRHFVFLRFTLPEQDPGKFIASRSRSLYHDPIRLIRGLVWSGPVQYSCKVTKKGIVHPPPPTKKTPISIGPTHPPPGKITGSARN